MTMMMPKLVVGVAIASLMFVTSGCVSQSDYDTKVGELKTQTDKLTAAEKAQKDAATKIKELEDKVNAAKDAAENAEKEQKAAADKDAGKDAGKGSGKGE